MGVKLTIGFHAPYRHYCEHTGYDYFLLGDTWDLAVGYKHCGMVFVRFGRFNALNRAWISGKEWIRYVPHPVGRVKPNNQ